MPKDKAAIGQILRQYGYNTFCVGKWHNTPDADTRPEGPFDRWPTAEMMGFDRFYGFLGGDCNQWYPPRSYQPSTRYCLCDTFNSYN